MDIDYWGSACERDISSDEYSIEEEFNILVGIYNKITDDFINKCNSKQKEIIAKLKLRISDILEMYKKYKINYQNELIDIKNNIKLLEDSNVKKLYSELDIIWREVEKSKYEICLSVEIRHEIDSYLEKKILEEKFDSCENIEKFIDGIGELIKNNYNANYLEYTNGSFDSIYISKFFNTEIINIKKLVKILWENVDEESDKFSLKLDIDKDKDIINQMVNIYKESNIFYRLCDIEYRNISSGEKAFFNIYSRFNSIKNDIENSNSNCESIVVLIDEIDLYFHPQWQKELIYNFSYLLSKIYKNKKIQIILSSHSPFVLSDIQKCNIVFMDKDINGKCIVCKGIDEEKETFAANIHTLFTDSFFVKEGLIGKLAKEKIGKIIDILTSSDDFKDDIERDNTKKLIYSIGEPLIRNKLINMYNQKVDVRSKEKIETLEKKMNFLEERIRELENRG